MPGEGLLGFITLCILRGCLLKGGFRGTCDSGEGEGSGR